MFNFKRPREKWSVAVIRQSVSCALEPLEGRQLLSAAPFMGHHGQHGFGGGSQNLTTIEFSQAPASVQSGLDALATADNLSDPTATQNVYLGNSNGVETYSVTLNGTGTVSKLTVDQAGNPVTAPTVTTITWGDLNGTGADANAAAASEISAIAAALNLTAPTDTTNVTVTTPASGTAVYSLQLPASSSSSSTVMWDHERGTTISVDANGLPVGNQNLPFSVIPASIQTALNSNAPADATAIDASSTQNVSIRTVDGVVTYSVTFTTSGTQTTVTVDSNGQLTSLPSETTAQFSDLPTAAQTELQTIATAEGITDPISSTQSVDVYNEANGVTIYSVALSATGTGQNGNSYTYTLNIAVDADGNLTTVPHDQSFGGGGNCGGGNGFNPGGPIVPIGFGSDGENDSNSGGTCDGSSSGSGSSSSSTSSGSSSSSSSSATTNTVAATSTTSKSALRKAAAAAKRAAKKAARLAAKAKKLAIG